MLRRTSDRQKKMLGRLAGLITAALLACLMMMGVMASEADRMPDLEEGMAGSLKVTMTCTDPNLETDNVKIMPNVQVKLAQVAGLQVNGGSADYTLLDAYKNTGIKLAGMTASESIAAAEKLAPLAAGTNVTTAATDSNGVAVFEDLEPGMYLVFQDTDANTAYRVDAIATFLVAVPYPAQAAEGNGWQYSVEIHPKTELTGPRNNGLIRVTKQLFNTQSQLPYNPPENQEIIFYVGLFTDEACTVRAAGTSDMPLRFLNSDTSTVVFENLTTDMTYYIAETDGKGNVVPSVLHNNILFEALYPNGQSVSITRQNPEGEILFQNGTPGIPMGYYYGGTLTVTKKTEMDGAEYETDDVFYAGLFTDKNLRTRYGDVITLEMNGSSSVSVPLEVNIGTSENESVTYYVAETDKDGKPLGSGQAFTISLNKTEGKVTLTPASPDDEVIITNKFTEEVQTERSTQTEGGNTTPQYSNDEGKSPQTGDETPIVRYVVLMAVALAVILGVVLFGRRRRKEK